MIEIVGLTKRFDDVVAVDDVTLTVRPGEVLALLGPNGAGKTTTVRMLASILKPSVGWARVAGYDIATEGHEVRRRVGVLTEAPGLYTRMTGWEYLIFFARLRGLKERERVARIESLATQFRVNEVLHRRLGGYSRGMRQKIALVRTLLHDPPVLLLDEPTSAMSPESARLVRDAILQLKDEAHRSVVLCTHNLPEAEELSDRIAIIRQGRIEAQGTARELKAEMLGPPLMELQLLNGVEGEGQRAAFDDRRRRAVDLVAALAAIESVGDVSIRYRTDAPGVVNSTLLKHLSQASIPVVTLSEVPQSLERVYLRVMGETAGDA